MKIECGRVDGLLLDGKIVMEWIDWKWYLLVDVKSRSWNDDDRIVSV